MLILNTIKKTYTCILEDDFKLGGGEGEQLMIKGANIWPRARR